MLDFHIDEEKCIQCGECAADCPNDIITMDNGFPQTLREKEDRCISCQHCFAVCPTGALSIFGLDPENSIELDTGLPSYDQLATLMKGRRSVRHYLDEELDKEVIHELIETVSNGPTGVNNRQLLFTVVEDQQTMETLRHRTIEAIRLKEQEQGLPEGLEFFSGIVAAADRGGDIIYRGAPHLLLVSSPANGPSPEPDCLIGLSYFELLAASRGLGTVWNGLAKWALTKIVPELLAELKVPEDHTIGYMMSFGKPAVKYFRTVQRGGARINRVLL
ncbi:MAG: nitroreductase family protein [Thermodesulfobacteriota bacterium]